MNTQEFYETIGVDYQELIKRLPESILKKILIMFKADASMSDLEKAINEKDAEKAFRAAHTLKGVCLNLELKGLQEVAISLTEKLRGRELIDYEEDYQRLKDQYNKIISLIDQID